MEQRELDRQFTQLHRNTTDNMDKVILILEAHTQAIKNLKAWVSLLTGVVIGALIAIVLWANT